MPWRYAGTGGRSSPEPTPKVTSSGVLAGAAALVVFTAAGAITLGAGLAPTAAGAGMALLSLLVFRFGELVRDQRALLRAHHEAVGKYQALVEQLPVATYIDSLDDPPTTLYISPQIDEVTGFAPRQITDHPDFWAARIHPDDRERALAELRRHRRMGNPLDVEYRFARRDGETVWLANRSRFMRNEGGRPLFSQGIVYDVTDRKNAEQPLRLAGELFKALFSNAPVGIALMDVSAKCLRVNEACARMVGYSENELASMSLRDLIVEEDVERASARFDDVAHGRANSCSGTLRLVRRDGERIVGRATLFPSGDGDGTSLIVAILEDITHQTTVGKMLRSQTEILEAIARDEPLQHVLDRITCVIEESVEHAVCSVLLMDDDGIHLIDGAGPSLSREYRDAIDGIRIGPGVGSCGRAAFTGRDVIVEDIATDPLWGDFRTIASAHGLRACWSSPIWSSDRKTVLGTFAVYFREPDRPDDGLRSLVAIAGDLAAVAIERDRARRQRARLEEQLLHSQKREAIGRLVGGISHDLNNVLTAVLANCDLLKQDGVAAGSQELVTEIESAAGMAGALVERLLDMGRPTVRRQRVFDAGARARELVPMLRRITRGDVEIDLTVAAGERPVVMEPSEFEQVLLNLVINAAEAMPEGGKVTISIGVVRRNSILELPEGASASDRYVLVRVADDGTGMDEDTRRRAFDPFFTTKKEGVDRGTGLGLSMVDAIVERASGFVAVDSSPGRGSEFRVYLPESRHLWDEVPTPSPVRTSRRAHVEMC